MISLLDEIRKFDDIAGIELAETPADFIKKSIQAGEQVQIEDVQICESVQCGLNSSGYSVGRYAPRLEGGEYLFHSLLKEEYLQSL